MHFCKTTDIRKLFFPAYIKCQRIRLLQDQTWACWIYIKFDGFECEPRSVCTGLPNILTYTICLTLKSFTLFFKPPSMIIFNTKICIHLLYILKLKYDDMKVRKEITNWPFLQRFTLYLVGDREWHSFCFQDTLYLVKGGRVRSEINQFSLSSRPPCI